VEEQPTEVSKAAGRSRVAQWSALMALGISALALAVGAYQTRLMQTQARASVWPYLVSGFNYADFGERLGFELHIQNNGVGPAIVQSTVVKLDGKPVKHWNDVIETLMKGHAGETAHASFSGLHGIVVPPSTNRETDVPAIRTSDAALGKALYEATDRLGVDICYCSIYDDCWQSHWLQRKPEPVSSCHETADEFDY
jgi:hypothetical protein